MDTKRREWYEALGVSPEATLEDIGAAYQDLVKIWHPDRFKTDPRVREKAEAKLKELSEAYHGLLAPQSEPQPKPVSGPTGDSPRGLPGFDPFGRESQRHWLQPTAPRPGDASQESRHKPNLPWDKIAIVSMLATIAMAARVWLWPIAMVMIPGGSSHPVTPVPPPQAVHPATPLISQPTATPLPPPAATLPALESSAPPPPAPTSPAPKAQPPRHLALKSTAAGTPKSTPSPARASGEIAKPYDGVIMLVTDGPFGTREYGTAFLIDRARAITTSRVVTDAARYQFSLAAITPDNQAYRAQVVCQSPLSGKRQSQREAAAGKDVALVQVDWSSPIKSLKVNTHAATLKGPASLLTPLPLNRLGLHAGERVLIVGYGRGGSSVTQLRQVGVVTDVSKTADGTAVFTGKFPKPPAPAERGAPVLNSTGEVVGVWTWETRAGDVSGGGISAPSLTCP